MHYLVASVISVLKLH